MGLLSFPSMASLCTTIFFIIFLSNPLATAQSAPTVYEILQQYDFPVGLLPKGVTSYELDRATGEFSVHLNKTCKFSIESYELEYKTSVSGVISKDKLTKLKGVSVKVLFLWFKIVEVDRDGDELEFSVGIASANFPVDNFYESPQCGCGFDCNKVADLVSSS